MQEAVSQTIGVISVNWLSIIDHSPKGILDPACDHANAKILEQLASLHSIAVDYPKTGRPVTMQEIPASRVRERPDWSEPELPDGNTTVYYQSQRWVGRLYRKIELVEPDVRRSHSPSTFGFPPSDDIFAIFEKNTFPRNDPVERAIRKRIADMTGLSPWRYPKDCIRPIWSCYKAYVSALRTICVNYSLAQTQSAMLTEEEVVLGTIAAPTNQTRMRKDKMMKMQEQTSQLVSRTTTLIVGSNDKDDREALKRAWVAFRISTIRSDAFGSRSFGLVAMRLLFDLLNNLEASQEPQATSASNAIWADDTIDDIHSAWT